MPLRRSPTPPPAISIRRAVEEGWSAFCSAPAPLLTFSALGGVGNLFCQLSIRHFDAIRLTPFGQPDRTIEVLLAGTWLSWWVINIWITVGLLQGANRALSQGRPRLRQMLRPDVKAMLRGAGALGLVLLVLGLIFYLSQASAWLMALLQPVLAGLPLVAGMAVLIYLASDQVLCLPITVLGQVNPLEAFREGRRAIDPHWLQALGLTLVLGLVVLAGLLMLLAGLVITLPIAICIQVSAYRQVFEVTAEAHRLT